MLCCKGKESDNIEFIQKTSHVLSKIIFGCFSVIPLFFTGCQGITISHVSISCLTASLILSSALPLRPTRVLLLWLLEVCIQNGQNVILRLLENVVQARSDPSTVLLHSDYWVSLEGKICGSSFQQINHKIQHTLFFFFPVSQKLLNADSTSLVLSIIYHLPFVQATGMLCFFSPRPLTLNECLWKQRCSLEGLPHSHVKNGF